jgi:hypothetical protein
MMTNGLTQHALIRMAQRGFQADDTDLIMLFGTPVEDGFLVLNKDCQVVERALKRLQDRIRRLSGKRLVVEGERVVTAYHARPTKKRWLLRHAEQRAMKGEGHGRHAGV